MSNILAAQPEPIDVAKAFYCETVTWVRHWTEGLFSFRTTRDPAQGFSSGQFVMVGLQLPDGSPLVRAYAFASSSAAPELEFYSIKTPTGPLTSKLQHIRSGDKVLVSKRRLDCLALDSLKPGKRLYLIATGTGLAPWLSVVRDPRTYARFDDVILTHTVRDIHDLCYRDLLEKDIYHDPHVGGLATAKLRYYPSITREPFKNNGRITDLITSGRLSTDLGLPSLDRDSDRVMLCGGPDLLRDMRFILLSRGFMPGCSAAAGDFALVKAFFG